MAPGACSTDRTGWAGTRQTARGIAQHRRLQREGSPHPPRASLSPPPHRRKEVQILEPDRSCANRTGHLDVLTILFISHLTNTGGCGNLQPKVSLTVSPFRSSFLHSPVVQSANHRFFTPLFSTSSESPFSQLLCFHIYLRCLLVSRCAHSVASVSLWQNSLAGSAASHRIRLASTSFLALTLEVSARYGLLRTRQGDAYMATSVWKGYLTFGLISIPIRLFSAARGERIGLNQLHSVCHSRIKMPLFCPVCDRKVERNEIVKGYEYEKDQYVLFDEKELDKIE